MKRLLYVAVGVLFGFGIGAVAAAEAQPKYEYGATCRGNGDGGYRACRVNVPGPAEKISLNVYVDGKFDIGMVWRPEREE